MAGFICRLQVDQNEHDINELEGALEKVIPLFSFVFVLLVKLVFVKFESAYEFCSIDQGKALLIIIIIIERSPYGSTCDQCK